jgi:hypothetical protein
MDSFALKQLRATSGYWRHRIGQFLIPLVWGGGVMTPLVWVGMQQPLFGLLLGFIAILGTFQEIYRLWQTRTFAITFYPNYFTIREGRTLKTFSYAEVEVISRQPNPTGRPDSETITFTLPDGQHEIVIDPYDRETLWQTLQRYIPAPAFAPDAAKHSLFYQRQRIDVENKIGFDHLLQVSDTSAVQQQLIRGGASVLGIGVILIGWITHDISWAFCLFGIVMVYLSMRAVQGKIELSAETIAHRVLLSRFEIRWDEIEYAETDFIHKVQIGNAQKWLTIPVPGNWSGKDKKMAYDFFLLQLAQHGITPQKFKPSLFRLSAKNTLVRRYWRK